MTVGIMRAGDEQSMSAAERERRGRARDRVRFACPDGRVHRLASRRLRRLAVWPAAGTFGAEYGWDGHIGYRARCECGWAGATVQSSRT